MTALGVIGHGLRTATDRAVNVRVPLVAGRAA